MSLYKSYLKFTKLPLINYLKSINVNLEFKSVQSAASYLSRNHTDAQIISLFKFTKRYLAENFSKLNRKEIQHI